MSANVDLVRSIVEAWERGDFTAAEWADANIEFVLPDGPDPGSWTGIAAMGEAWGRRISAAESFRIAAEEFRELDDERVLSAANPKRASGASSGCCRPRSPTAFRAARCSPT